MNKKSLTEADIRTKFITPALAGLSGNKWDVMTQIREESYFTKCSSTIYPSLNFFLIS
ncbi:MAG: restriction endonuclease [Chthoniobacteraceae bacterium]|nr:restriction endonuclease [Chthoniobacteraceae bacterium]